MQLGVPLTLQTVTMVNGSPEVRVTDFVPNPSYPVEIVLKRGSKERRYDARMDGNIAVFEDDGTLEAGIYSITVLCRDVAGKQKRFKQRDAVKVVDVTADAGIEASIEYNTEVHILDAAVFIAVNGGGNGGSGDGKYHVLLTQAQYDALDTYDDNAIYMIYEPES